MTTRARWLLLCAALCAAIVASLGGCSDDDPLGPGRCETDVTSLDFGRVGVGESTTRSFTIRNVGQQPISIDVALADSACPFAIESGGGPTDLPAGAEQLVTVRFSPPDLEAATCDVTIGAECEPVACSGAGDGPPVCSVSPDTLDFGVVSTGYIGDLTFTIANTGGGTLTGTVPPLPCAEFALRGSGAYSVAAGQSRLFTIRFSPPLEESYACSVQVDTTFGCGAIFVRGTGGPAPVCALSAVGLDFGTVQLGDSLDMPFQISNVGGGSLEGAVSLPLYCLGFSLRGGFVYDLGPGESTTFTVHFEPFFSNAVVCTINTGSRQCPDIILRGFGDPLPICETDFFEIDFGEVPIGGSVDRPIRFWNVGGGVLSGTATVDVDCESYEIVGDPDYALATGDTATIVVRFAPQAFGPNDCLLSAGTFDCLEIVLLGDGIAAPVCSVNPATLEFGAVPVGNVAQRSFTIANNGIGVVTGFLSETCDDFVILEEPAYDLGQGESRLFTVVFTPTSDGVRTCEIETGNAGCSDVTATARGVIDPDCDVAPTALNFGSVALGASADLPFTVRNDGGDTLSGTISIPAGCQEYSILGGASYALAADQSSEFVIRFTPQTIDGSACTIETGSSLCADVVAFGSGAFATSCSLSTTALDFGTVTAGDAVDRNFTISNRGAAPLSGTVSLEGACPGFALIGTTSYVIGEGQTEVFTLRFAPLVDGDAICSVETGTDSCPDITAFGSGFVPPQCSLSVAALAFGGVQVGESADRAFSITNTGGGALAGVVSSPCSEFLVLGDVSYSLGGGESQEFLVRFAPATVGPKNCTIATGAASCADLGATGTGTPAPVCVVEPEMLALGEVDRGDSTDGSFMITNTGGGMLIGVVSLPAACSEFSIVGAASYNLGSGESQTFIVQYKPATGGADVCDVQTGAAQCADVAVSGIGRGAPACSLAIAQIDFGDLTVDACLEDTFRIFNTGDDTLFINPTIACSDTTFKFAAPPPTIVLPSASRKVSVRFLPKTAVAKACSVVIGSGCPSVRLIGRGTPGPICSISPTTLDFGTVPADSFADLTFTISNAGGDSLVGSIIDEFCEEFKIVADEPADLDFRLAPGGSKAFTVRYSPMDVGSDNEPTCMRILGSFPQSCQGILRPDLCGPIVLTGTGSSPAARPNERESKGKSP